MENFTNETIDTKQLPRFEKVLFTKLHPNYWKVVLINLAILFVVAASIFAFFYINNDPFFGNEITILSIAIGVMILIVIFARLAFVKKGYAFRTHDVLFSSGIIATNKIVIPYNRIQHVALHEGLLARFFGLAKVEIFTAGGSSSDIEIPGILKDEAENIKQLLMGKIQKEL